MNNEAGPQPNNNQNSPQTGTAPNSIYPEPVQHQYQTGVSASELGLNQRQKKPLNIKKIIIGAGLFILLIVVAVAALVHFNIIAFGEFKTVNYANDKGDNFSLKFYSKHTTKKTRTNNQLVSKVSNDGKFPITMSISTGTGTKFSSFDNLKNCSGFTKVFEVHNNSLNQTISVCDAVSGAASGTVYVAGFTDSNKLHIITIGQDYGQADLSSQSAAKNTLTKFGLNSYQDDLQKIISSIQIK